MANSLFNEIEQSTIRGLEYLKGSCANCNDLPAEKLVYLAYVAFNHAAMKCLQAISKDESLEL